MDKINFEKRPIPSSVGSKVVSYDQRILRVGGKEAGTAIPKEGMVIDGAKGEKGHGGLSGDGHASSALPK